MKKTLFLISCLVSLSSFAYDTILVSHRGSWWDQEYGQDTVAALNKALDEGFKAVEFDLRLTKDGELMVLHDVKMNAGTNCKGKIGDKTFAEVKDCMITHNRLPVEQLGRYVKVKKPTKINVLKDVVEEVMPRPELEMIWFDLKNYEMEPLLAALHRDLDGVDPKDLAKIIFYTDSEEIVKALKVQFPDCKTSWGGYWGSEPVADLEKYLPEGEHSHDFVSMNVYFPVGHESFLKIFGRQKRFRRMLDEYMEVAEERGYETIAWSVSNKKLLKFYLEKDFVYLLTDLNPEMLEKYQIPLQ